MYRSRRAPDRCLRQRGNIALITALMITMLMAFVALSFDVGNLFRVRTESQSGLDAAALAGASALGTGAPATVQARAVSYANQHFANRGNLTLTAGDVEIGVWDLRTRTFAASLPADPSNVPAVRVTFNQPVTTPFAGVGGNTQSTVGARAVAIRGGPARATCGFPLVIPDCAVSNASQRSCDVCLQMQSSNTDNGAWTSYNLGRGQSDSGIAIGQALQAACFTAGGSVAINGSGTCAGSCTERPTADTQIGLNNGNLMNNGNNNFCPMIERLLTRDCTQAPTPFTVEVPVISTGTGASNCGSANLTGSQRISGFVRMQIFGVRCGNSGDAVLSAATPPPACQALSAGNATSGSGNSGNQGGGNSGNQGGGNSGNQGGGNSTCRFNTGTNASYTPPSGKFLLASLLRGPNGTCDQNTTPAPGGGAYYGTYGRPVLVE